MKTEVLQKPTQKIRTVYLDYLRVLATFAVIVIHVCADLWTEGSVLSLAWNTLTVYECLVRWCVPIFVMISGVLFLNPSKETNLKLLFFKNILRLVIAYTFWSFAHALIENRHEINILKILSQTVGGVNHLWFVPMIIGVYLVVPFLKGLIKDTQLTKLFLTLFFLFTVLIPQIIVIIYDCLNINLLVLLADPFRSFLKNMNFFLPLGYVGYFVLGFTVNRINLSKKQRIMIYVCGLIGFVSTFVFTIFASVRLSKPATFFFDYLTVNVMLESISVFVFFKYLFQKIKISNKVNAFVAKLSKYSFGIYLCHMLVLKVAEKIGLTAVSFNTIFAVPVTALFVFVVSCIISAIIHKIPVLKKYIV